MYNIRRLYQQSIENVTKMSNPSKIPQVAEPRKDF